jgi:hypothetical protein
MSGRGERRWFTTMIPALGGCLGVLLVPIVLGVALTAWAATSLDGCDVDVDLGPSALGVSSRPGGPIRAVLPSCAAQQFTYVRLLAGDGSTLWSAEAPRAASVERFTVGTAPPGFRDSVPLADRPLDPHATYDLQVLVMGPAEPTTTATVRSGEASMTAIDPALMFGARARFRPVDLRPDRIWVDGRLVAPERLDRLACASDDSAS